MLASSAVTRDVAREAVAIRELLGQRRLPAPVLLPADMVPAQPAGVSAEVSGKGWNFLITS